MRPAIALALVLVGACARPPAPPPPAPAGPPCTRAGDVAPKPPAPDARRILLVGNSQLGVSENGTDLARALEQLADARLGPGRWVVQTAQVLGSDCPKFAKNADVVDALKHGGFQTVVFAPALNEDYSGGSACWQRIYDMAVAGGAKTFAILQTGTLQRRYPGGFDEMRAGVNAFARAHGAIAVPAGDAWRRALGDAPAPADLRAMYAHDGTHPSAQGMYLYATAILGALTGESVAGAPRDLPGLRCSGDARCCLSLDALDACAAAGTCADQAPLDGNGNASVVTVEEAARFQAAVAAALAAASAR